MFSLYNDILNIVKEVLQSQDYFYIGIDGDAGAGKSTLAKDLAKVLDADIIAMDDFFLPLEKRSAERLNMPGGNIDYERFIEEIYDHRWAKSFKHCRYDCHLGKMTAYKEIIKKAVIIIEGSYALHPKFRDLYDLNIYMQVSEELQKSRIKERNPEDYDHFINQWIPMEKAYFAATKPLEISDISILSE